MSVCLSSLGMTLGSVPYSLLSIHHLECFQLKETHTFHNLRVSRCSPTLQVPEIIGTLRQVGKSSARNDDAGLSSGKASGGGGDPPETCFSSVSTATASAAATASCGPVSPTVFSKKFEVLFCGRVTVAHKKAPPALIDECIEKFGQLHGCGQSRKADGDGGLAVKRALALPANGLRGGGVGNGCGWSPKTERRPILLKRDASFPCLQDLDENGLSPEISHSGTADAQQQCTGVQPTSLQENRTMLFTVTHMYSCAVCLY